MRYQKNQIQNDWLILFKMYSFLGTVTNIILVKYPKIRESHHATQNPIGTNVKYTQNGASR